MPELAAPVYVHDDQGQTHVFVPGEQVPGWAIKKITNPDVWQPDTGRHRDTDSVEPPPPDEPPAVKKPAR